jgi:hypothetical protein
MTNNQSRRQSHRGQDGKYAEVNPCQCCGKSAGLEYFSHHDTDVTIGDELICLCKSCHEQLDDMGGEYAVCIAKKAKAYTQTVSGWKAWLRYVKKNVMDGRM